LAFTLCIFYSYLPKLILMIQEVVVNLYQAFTLLSKTL